MSCLVVLKATVFNIKIFDDNVELFVQSCRGLHVFTFSAYVWP